MKRILYSCLFLVSLSLTNFVKGQAGTFSITPQFQCFNASGSYTSIAEVVGQSAGATSYSWAIQTSVLGCNATFTTAPGGTPTNTHIGITIPCCCDYTVTCVAFNGATPTATLGYAFATSTSPTIGIIYCATGASVTTTPTNICIGSSATLSALGASNFTAISWSNGTGGNTPTIAVAPNVNTCFTYTAITAQGCTVTPATAACVSVQAISATLTPASQTMCGGSPVSFTATSTVLTSSVTAGTAVTGYTWVNPSNATFSTTGAGSVSTVTTAAQAGLYTVNIVHTGAAGTCTLVKTGNVVISTSIPVTITPSSNSICPGTSMTLTAISAPTTAAGYTWTQNTTPVATAIGSGSSIVTPTLNPPTTFTVDVNYGGCPGQTVITIGVLALTPTLTTSAGISSCPGQSIQLTGAGGVTYTFMAITATGTTISPLPSSGNTATHTPGGTAFPITYSVITDSSGCKGSTSLVVTTRTLFPILTASSPSICPNTEFTLTSTSNGSSIGAGTNYTFTAPYVVSPPTSSVIYSGANNTATTTPPLSLVFPKTWTVTVDSSGCKGSATVTVGLLTLTPTLTASSPSICAGSQLTLTTHGNAINYTYTTRNLAPTISPTVLISTTTSSTQTHVPSATATAISYTVRVDSVGCKGVATTTVGILDLGPLINYTTSAASGSVCPNSPVNFTAMVVPSTGGYSYTFTASSGSAFGPGGTSTVATHTAPNPIPGTGISYTIAADSGGCVGLKTFTLNKLTLHPIVSITPTLVCGNNSVVSTNSVVVTTMSVGSVPSSPTTFSYISSPPPTTFSNGVISYSAVHFPTVQTVYAVVADSANCTGISPTVTVQIRPDLILTPSSTAASVCPGTPATLSVVSPTDVTSALYTWTASSTSGTLSPFPVPTSSNALVVPLVNTTYSISAIDSLGCIGNTVITVGIDPSLSFSVILASSGSTICAPQSVTLTASSPSVPGSVSYTWTPTTALIPSSGLGATVVASPTTSTTYSVLADNGYGCLAVANITVPVGTYPNFVTNPIATPYHSVCPAFTTTLTAQGAVSYTWTGAPLTGTMGPIAQASISVGPGTYTVLASNGGGCTSSTFITIGIANPLNITLSQSSSTTCIESNTPKFSKPVHLSASGAATYVWFPYNPNHMTYSLGPQTDVRPPASTCYTVTGATAICSGTAVICVNVIPQFTMDVTPPLPALCLGDSLPLNVVNISTMAVGPATSFSYTWYEALNAPPISISSYGTRTVMVFPQNTTTYTVEVADARHCMSLPRLVTVTVLPRPQTAVAIPTINNVPTNTVCFVGLNPGPQDVVISLTGNNTNTGLQFGVVPTYTWLSPYGVKYNSILTPTSSNAVIVNAPVREFNGSPIVTYTLISGYQGVPGCKRMDTVSIRVVDCRPVMHVYVDTAEPNDTICTKNCVTFVNHTDTAAGGPQKLKWYFQGGSPSTSTLNVQTVCYNLPGEWNVILTVENPYPKIQLDGSAPGSSYHFSALKYIKVADIPNVTIVSPGQVRSDTTVRFGQSVFLSGSGANSYEWSPGYNITSLTNPKVTVSPFKTTQYILTGYNSKRCSSSDTINVIVIEDCGEMYVPNAFTPNNDGANDVLYVRGICLQSLTFMIFNRWGEKVFETNDQKVGWDGTYKGEEMNTGVFVYRLEGKTYEGKAFSSKGNITLIR